MDSWQDLEKEWDVPIAPICSGGIWQAWTPTLVFDAKGSVRLAYDATYHAYCWWDTDKQKWVDYYQYFLVKRTVRTVLVTVP
jgi:hypothetical protein